MLFLPRFLEEDTDMTMLRPMLSLSLFVGLCALPGCGDEVNLDAVPEAKAGCEAPTADALREGGTMLPGRNCNGCHKTGGQAAEYVWTASGTVYNKRSVGAACNTNGAEGVLVELIDMTDKVLARATTNSTGNFYFTDSQFSSGNTPVRARVTKGAVTRTMLSPVSVTGGCAVCHQPGGAAGDRIFVE
jgi:hypothetical protein